MKEEEVQANVIYYTTKLSTLIEVINKVDEVKGSNLLKEDFIPLLGRYIKNKTGMVLVSFGEDKKLNGCMIVSKQRDKKGLFLWIDLAWISPKYPKLHIKYRDEIMEACKMRGIKRIQARMRKGFGAMERLYGAKEIAKILEKELI